jgi:hypothetical protein
MRADPPRLTEADVEKFKVEEQQREKARAGINFVPRSARFMNQDDTAAFKTESKA